MKLDFDDILEKEKGKIGIVCGLGGSLKDYADEFENLSKTQKDKYCFISCNRWFSKTKIDADYWVMANNTFTVEKNYNAFNNKNKILIYADSVDLTDKEFVDNNLKIDYLPFDERHQGGNKCLRNNPCCKHADPGRKTIQEYLKHISGNEERYSGAGTVGIHMLALAVILGCNPVYISGIDMDYGTGYVDNSKLEIHDDISKYRTLFGKQAKIISDSAEKLGIEIINLNDKARYEGLKKGKFNRYEEDKDNS